MEMDKMHDLKNKAQIFLSQLEDLLPDDEYNEIFDEIINRLESDDLIEMYKAITELQIKLKNVVLNLP